ncbi:MAG: hypothetical protein ACI9Y7_000110 [Dokdonia sp.]|jgi:hypothetical protein
MGCNLEISKNIKFYYKEMQKWEKRVIQTSIILFFSITIITIIGLFLNDWSLELVSDQLQDTYKYFLVSPIAIYLRFSIIQYSSFKKQMNTYRSGSVKYTFIKENDL